MTRSWKCAGSQFFKHFVDFPKTVQKVEFSLYHKNPWFNFIIYEWTSSHKSVWLSQNGAIDNSVNFEFLSASSKMALNENRYVKVSPWNPRNWRNTHQIKKSVVNLFISCCIVYLVWKEMYRAKPFWNVELFKLKTEL